MSAARERAALAAIGRDLLRSDGGPGERRAAALMDRVAGRDAPPATLAELLDAPIWLRLPRDRQRRIATAAALLSMGPMLAGSIDGAWLGRLVERTGEALLDWAIDRAEAMPADGDLSPLAADELEAAGFALLRAELPPAMRRYLRWAPGGVAAARAPQAVAAAVDAPDDPAEPQAPMEPGPAETVPAVVPDPEPARASADDPAADPFPRFAAAA